MLVPCLLLAQEIDIRIMQNGKLVVPKNDVYQLANKSFSIQVTSTGIEGFLVGVTTDEFIYKSALGEADLQVMWFEETGMAESLFNADKEIFVSNDAPSYWYFSSTKDHRFDLGADGTKCSWRACRTINSFYFMDTEESLQVKRMKQPLYLYFYDPSYDEEYNLVDRKCVFKATLFWE